MRSYLRSQSYDPSGPHCIRPLTLTRYCLTAAAMTVLSYVLGVGDRHLDNIVLTREGHLMHVDFGFVLGQDPKPFQPLVRIAPEMLDALGSAGSHDRERFFQACQAAFLALRRRASSLLALCRLHADDGLTDLRCGKLHIHTYTHTHIHTQYIIHIYTHTHKHIHACTYIHTSNDPCIHYKYSP